MKWKANISIEIWASNATIGFDLDHDLDLEFSRSNMEFAISQLEMARLPRKKSKHIYWTQGLKCDHGVWPWPWPWPRIFKVKYGICYITVKNGPIAANQKELYRLNSKLQMWPWGSTLAMTFTLNFQGQIWKFAISQSKLIRRSGVRIYNIVTGVTSDAVDSSSSMCKCHKTRKELKEFGWDKPFWSSSI